MSDFNHKPDALDRAVEAVKAVGPPAPPAGLADVTISLVQNRLAGVRRLRPVGCPAWKPLWASVCTLCSVTSCTVLSARPDPAQHCRAGATS